MAEQQNSTALDRSANLMKLGLGVFQFLIGLAVLVAAICLLSWGHITLGGALFCFGIANLSFGIERLRYCLSRRQELLYQTK